MIVVKDLVKHFGGLAAVDGVSMEIEKGKISEKAVNGTMIAIYAFTFITFGLNIGLSYAKSGWFTI